MHKIVFALSFLAASALAVPECPPLGSPWFLLPHETDCTKFYICAHGIPELQTCPDGTHFSPMHMVCQNPVFAGCDRSPPESELPCTWPDNILFHPHPETCSKYYVCEHGSAIVFDCPHGLEFNAELRECVWPHESNCNISQDGPTDDGSQDGGSQDVAQNDEQNVDEQNADEQNGAEHNGRCVNGELSAHEDCGKYYICNHGRPLAMDCPAGLHWNSQLSFCDWPVSAGCQ